MRKLAVLFALSLAALGCKKDEKSPDKKEPAAETKPAETKPAAGATKTDKAPTAVKKDDKEVAKLLVLKFHKDT